MALISLSLEKSGIRYEAKLISDPSSPLLFILSSFIAMKIKISFIAPLNVRFSVSYHTTIGMI